MNGLDPVPTTRTIVGCLMVFYLTVQLALLPSQLSAGKITYCYIGLFAHFFTFHITIAFQTVHLKTIRSVKLNLSTFSTFTKDGFDMFNKSSS